MTTTRESDMAVAQTHDDVEAALERAIETHGDVGVQVAAYLNGELIVDAWAGRSDTGEQSTPVDGESLFPIFSVSKAVAAIALHIQAERGLVRYGTEIARYWPEFAQNGKEHATVYDLLTHRLGIPVMPMGVTPELMCDWDWMTEQIAVMRPTFEPGTRQAYLSLTFGWVLGEIVRRTDPAHRPFGDFVRDEICQPLGIENVYFGIPDAVEDRIVTLIDMPAPPPGDSPLAEGGLYLSAMPPSVTAAQGVYGRSDVRRACIPAGNGIATARDLGKVFAMLAGYGETIGVRLLSEDRVRLIGTPGPPVQYDYVYGVPNNISVGAMHLSDAIGDQVPPRQMSATRSTTAMGHPGRGGQIAWADPRTGLAVAMVRNRMLDWHVLDPQDNPVKVVADAVFEVAGLD